MNDARLLAWRRRLGISPVMEKRLRRMVNAVEREEREACVCVALEAGLADDGTQSRIIDALKRRKS